MRFAMPLPDTFWKQKHAHLRYCIVWCSFAWMRVVVFLPLELQLALGRWTGALAHILIRSRRRIVSQNLRACFPSMSVKDRKRIARRHFGAMGMSIVEMAMGWYGSPTKIARYVDIVGLPHLEAALAHGRGVILLSAHFTAFEIFFPILKNHCGRLSGMYKVQRNPLMNEIMTDGRGRNIDCLFPKDNVRELIRELRRNAVVWYASDQSFRGSYSQLLPFFGVPAMTNTAISRIAASTGAIVLPYFCKRLPGRPLRYEAIIEAPLPDFPSQDPADDVMRFNKTLEAFIRGCPEQYWWIHQRFKGRPESLPDIYANDD